MQPLLAAARDSSHRLSRIHALWGVTQLARKSPEHASQLTQFLRDRTRRFARRPPKMIGDVRYAQGGDALLQLFKDDSARARFFAAEALGRIAYKAAVGPLIEMLEANADRDVYLRHAGSLALALIGDATAIGRLAKHPSAAYRLAAVVALRRLASRTSLTSSPTSTKASSPKPREPSMTTAGSKRRSATGATTRRKESLERATTATRDKCQSARRHGERADARRRLCGGHR